MYIIIAFIFKKLAGVLWILECIYSAITVYLQVYTKVFKVLMKNVTERQRALLKDEKVSEQCYASTKARGRYFK